MDSRQNWRRSEFLQIYTFRRLITSRFVYRYVLCAFCSKDLSPLTFALEVTIFFLVKKSSEELALRSEA